MRNDELLTLDRRRFFTSAASGAGQLALASLLAGDGLLAPARAAETAANPLAPRPPHFAPKARHCIFFLLEGGPSQFDLFDPKPTLQKLHSQKLPESLVKDVRFAFIQKESATVLGTDRKFARHGQCGMEFSDLLPRTSALADELCMIRSMHTDQFNHHPAQLMLMCGRAAFGLPTIGAWMVYGLGSPSQNMPGYVVLTCGRGSTGAASLWQSGFLSSTYAGVLLRSQGDAVLNLSNPAGLPPDLQRAGLDALRDLNQQRLAEVHDPEIAARVASYELAYRMQAAAPELVDLSREDKRTLEMYGLDRADPKIKADRGGGPGQYRAFATNCLLARRLVESGVRFVSIVHASWDHHSNLNVELPFNCGMADQPFAALIADLKQRGLLDQTLVVWGSEFGRTPLGENRKGREANTGRDHHPFAYTLLLAGGGIKGGVTLGASDEIGWHVVEDPVHVNDLQATLLHLFGLDHLKLTYRNQGRDFRLTDVGGKLVRKILA